MTKPCDACQSGNAVIYCRADTAYLCSTCDTKVHGANKLASRHERVLVCDVCEHAPAAVTCKADAAALCVNCDNDIHSANPLARRHERVPVTPFYEFSANQVGGGVNPDEQQQCSLLVKEDEEDEEEESSAAEAASWLLADPGSKQDEDEETLNCVVVALGVKEEDDATTEDDSFSDEGTKPAISAAVKESCKFIKSLHHQQQQSFDLFSDVDPYLDLDFVSALGALQPVSDSLVPIQALADSSPVTSNSSDSYDMEIQHKPGHNFCAELSLSTSSIDVGVVPDSGMSDISTPQSRPSCLMDFSHHHQQRPAPLHHATPLEPMAREARVLRYREKRKNRKFEKTIRYASRKAYAETRPRIKGRFAKRSELEVEHMYAVVPDTSFGVVPSF